MAISFSGAKKYKKRCGIPGRLEVKTPLPSAAHTYTLEQNGSLLTPLVCEGERVFCGQKLADIDEFDTIPVISSVSGTVSELTPHTITVSNDTLYEAGTFTSPANDLTTREKLWILRESGVYERLSSQPIHVILSEKKVSECIIVCCFDSDPYVSSPQAAASGNAEKILRSLETAMSISGVTKAYIAVENDTRKTFSDFKYLLRYREDIELCLLKARYPQSRADVLTRTLTGRENTDAIILSPETLCHMSDALEHGIPVTKKIVTVSGDDILEPNNFAVPLGASIASLLESGGYTSPETVILGGAIDGKEITDLDTPITADVKAVLAFEDKSNLPKYRK